MKKIVIAIALTLALTAGFILGIALRPQEKPIDEHLYLRITHVVEVNEKADTVACVDEYGEGWEFYGAEDFEEGQCVVLVLHDNNTRAFGDD